MAASMQYSQCKTHCATWVWRRRKVHSFVNSAKHKLLNFHSKIDSRGHGKLFNVRCGDQVQCTVYTVQCTLSLKWCEQCSVHIIHCTLHTTHYTLHTTHYWVWGQVQGTGQWTNTSNWPWRLGLRKYWQS